MGGRGAFLHQPKQVTYMGLFKRLHTKKDTGEYLTAEEKRFIEASKEEVEKLSTLHEQ